ncbi:PAS domain-containing protein [Ferruginibacter sp.]
MKLQHDENAPLVDKSSFAINDATKNNLLSELTSIPDIVIQTDIHFNITGWNTAAEKICSPDISIGKNVFELEHVDLSDVAVEQIKKEFSENSTWNGNIRFRRSDGEYLYFRSSAHYVLDASSKPASIIITNHNIAGQVIAEQKLNEHEAIQLMLMNTLDEGVLLIDGTGAIMDSNRRVTEILSISQEQLLGQVPVSAGGWKVFRPDGRPFPNSELPVVVSLLTGFPQKNVEMRLQNPAGDSVWLSVNSQALIREGEFSPYAVVVSFSDISKAKLNSVF